MGVLSLHRYSSFVVGFLVSVDDRLIISTECEGLAPPQLLLLAGPDGAVDIEDMDAAAEEAEADGAGSDDGAMATAAFGKVTAGKYG